MVANLATSHRCLRPPWRRRPTLTPPRAQPPSDAAAEVATLAALLPGVPAARLARLPPALRSELAADRAGVATRLAALRVSLPGADLSALVTRAPSALTHAGAARIAANAPILRRLFAEAGRDAADASAAAAAAPELVLSRDLAFSAAELSRLIPGASPGDVLARHPHMILALQRGEGELGPPAEVVSDI